MALDVAGSLGPLPSSGSAAVEGAGAGLVRANDRALPA